MAIADDFSVAANGDIRYTGGGPTYTVIQLHRFLQDLADDAVASGDDLLDITDQTPSDRSTDNIITLINGYNIDDTAAQSLYDGSITQAGGDTVYSGLVVVGAVPAGTNLQLVQNGALLTNYWGTGLNTDAGANILLRVMVKTRDQGANIDGQRLRVQARELGDSYAEFSLTAGLGNATAAIFTASDLNNQTAAGTISGWTSIVNIEGLNLLDVTGDAVNEEYYSQWDLGTQTINVLYERTKWIQRRATAETIHAMNGELFRGVTHSFAYDAEAGAAPDTNLDYAWGLFVTYDTEAVSSFAVGEAVTIGSAIGRVLSLDDNGTAGTLVVAIESGVPADNDAILGLTSGTTALVNGAPVGQATGGGVGTILAVNDGGTTGAFYIQLIKGTVPADNTVLYQDTLHTGTVTVNGAITTRTISPAFIGQSTGSALIGAYGIGVQPADLTASDLLFDLTNTPNPPPNNVTFTVNGLVHAEDRVLVGPESGGLLQVDQFGLNAILNTDNITSVVIDAAIPSDTPSAGTIRVFDDNGIARRLEYTSYTGSTFTIDPTASEAHDATTTTVADFIAVEAAAANDVFISYIDQLAQGTLVTSGSFTIGVAYVITATGTTDFTLIGAANSTPGTIFTATGAGTGTGTATTRAATATFTSVYLANRSLFIRVRDGGATPIRTFETTGTLGAAGGSSTAIRTSDA